MAGGGGGKGGGGGWLERGRVGKGRGASKCQGGGRRGLFGVKRHCLSVSGGNLPSRGHQWDTIRSSSPLTLPSRQIRLRVKRDGSALQTMALTGRMHARLHRC